MKAPRSYEKSNYCFELPEGTTTLHIKKVDTYTITYTKYRTQHTSYSITYVQEDPRKYIDGRHTRSCHSRRKRQTTSPLRLPHRRMVDPEQARPRLGERRRVEADKTLIACGVDLLTVLREVAPIGVHREALDLVVSVTPVAPTARTMNVSS